MDRNDYYEARMDAESEYLSEKMHELRNDSEYDATDDIEAGGYDIPVLRHLRSGAPESEAKDIQVVAN